MERTQTQDPTYPQLTVLQAQALLDRLNGQKVDEGVLVDAKRVLEEFVGN